MSDDGDVFGAVGSSRSLGPEQHAPSCGADSSVDVVAGGRRLEEGTEAASSASLRRRLIRGRLLRHLGCGRRRRRTHENARQHRTRSSRSADPKETPSRQGPAVGRGFIRHLKSPIEGAPKAGALRDQNAIHVKILSALLSAASAPLPSKLCFAPLNFP